MENEYFKCLEPDCKMVYPKFPTLLLHYGKEHKGAKFPTKAQTRITEVPEGYQLQLPQKQERPPKELGTESGTESGTVPAKISGKSGSVYRETPEPSSILRGILETYPGLEKSVVTEIMDWAQYKGTMHPMEVRQLLSLMAGVPKGAVEIIPQKYSMAMMKAAQEGRQEVQMALSNWQYNTPGGGGNFMPFGAVPGQGQWGNPIAGFNPGFPGLGMFGFQNSPFWNPNPIIQPVWNPNAPQVTPPETPADIERNKRLDKLEEEQSGINKNLEALIQKMTETEQEKKEAAINARLEKLEDMLVQIASSPKTNEEKDKAYEALLAEIKETRTEIARVKEEAAQNRITALETSVKNLAAELTNRDKQRVEQLQKDLEEAKNYKPVTGRTEMDVVDDLATKALDTVKEAGRDVKSILLSGHTRKEFNPDRGDIRERTQAGEKIAGALESEAALVAAESAYLGST